MGQSALRRLRVAAHGADLFVDPGSGYVYPQFEGLEADCKIVPYDRRFQVSDHDHFPHAMGEKTAEIKFMLEGRGFGGSPAGAGSGVAAGDGESGLLLKSVFGSQVKDTGSVAAASTTASVIKVVSTALFTVGAFIGCVDPATGLFHARQIRSKTATDLTLDRALPFTPAVAATIYASAAYSHAVDGHQHLFFDAEGYDATPAKGWRRSIFGCLGDVEFQGLSANGRMMMAFTFRGVDWDQANEGANQPAPTYPANLPASGGFVRNTRLWVGASQLEVAEFGYKLGNAIQPKAATAAKNGVASWFVSDAEQTMTMKVSAEAANAAGLHSARANKTLLDVLVEMTQGGPGNSLALAAPAVQITELTPSTLNGLDYWDVSLSIKRHALAGVPAAMLGVL